MDYNALVSRTNYAFVSEAASSRRSVTLGGTEGGSGSGLIPTSTPNVVIVRSFSKALVEPVGTIKSKAYFDDEFPLFLIDKVDPADYTHTIDGVNWFADLLHEAELEYYAEKYHVYDAWKPVQSELDTEEGRKKIIKQICKQRNEEVPVTVFPRRRILNEKDLKTYQTIVSKWLHQFLADENASVYLPKGIKFNSPEKNNWKWFEIHVLNDSQKDHHTSNPVAPSNPRPPKPQFGNDLHITVSDPLEVSDHTEYMITIRTDKESWYPYHYHKVLRRFNDFKDFADMLASDMERKGIRMRLTEIPEPSYFGRKSKSTIQMRLSLFQQLMNDVTKDPLCNHPLLLRFLGIRPQPDSWRYRHYFAKEGKKATSESANGSNGAADSVPPQRDASNNTVESESEFDDGEKTPKFKPREL